MCEDADRDHRSDSREKAFGGDEIDQCPDGDLQDQGREGANGQDQPDIELRPSFGSQIGGDKRSPSRLDVSEEECKPIEPALTPPRRMMLFEDGLVVSSFRSHFVGLTPQTYERAGCSTTSA